MEATKRGSVTKQAMLAEVRERRIGPNGEPNGPTSWAAMATVERLREVIAAADAGVVLASEPTSSGNAGDAETAFASALSALLARPAGLDVDAVESIATRIARDIVSADGGMRITVTGPAPTKPIDVGVQHKMFPVLLEAMDANIPVLLTGPAGSGKSEAVKAAAAALSLPFVADSFSADSGRHDVFGFMDANGHYVATAFRPAFEMGQVYCADEVDNGTANLGAAFNLALSNGHANFPDVAGVLKSHAFRFAATSNTIHGATLSFNGREALDRAMLDRCLVIEWPIDTTFERRLARNRWADADSWVDTVIRVREAMDAAGLDRLSPSPRASINGAILLGRGKLSREQVMELCLFRGCDPDARARIAKAAGK